MYYNKESEKINQLLKANNKKQIWEYIKRNSKYRRDVEGPSKKEWERFVEGMENDRREKRVEDIGGDNYLSLDTRDLDGEITKEEITKGAMRMKGNKAAGLDLVQGKLWKEILRMDKYIDLMVKIFNRMWKSNEIPENWKMAEVVPIYKNKGKREDPNNYRKISLLPAIMKLYTGILANRLIEWAEKFNVIAKWQNGFRRNRRITRRY